MPVSPDDGANLVRCRTRILVLPDPDRRPSSSSQHAIYLGVPLSGSLQLQEPVVSVCPRSDRVLGTPVPEAAVDENGDADTAEYEISRSAQGRDRTLANPVTESPRVHVATNCELRTGVPTAIGQHGGPGSLR